MWCCGDCCIDRGENVYVCSSRGCRDRHALSCSYVCVGTGVAEGGPVPTRQSAAPKGVPATISDKLAALAEHAHSVALDLGQHHADTNVLLLVVGTINAMSSRHRGGRS